MSSIRELWCDFKKEINGIVKEIEIIGDELIDNPRHSFEVIYKDKIGNITFEYQSDDGSALVTSTDYNTCQQLKGEMKETSIELPIWYEYNEHRPLFFFRKCTVKMTLK